MSRDINRHECGLTWTESSGLKRSAHALRAGDAVWLIDPFEDDTALSAAAELGRPAGVIQLLDRHNRDCATIAQRLEIPLLKLPGEVPDSPFEPLTVIDRRWWHETALWWPEQSALIVAEAVGTVPAFALGRPLGLHPMLRLTPPRGALTRHAPERVLVGHGPVLGSGGAAAIGQALSAARGDIPRLVRELPTIVRGG